MMSLKFKRYYRLLLLFVFVVAFFAIAFVDTRIIAYIVKNKGQTSEVMPIVSIDNEVELFDETVVHEIQILMPDTMHTTMIETFKYTGLKEYFRVDIVIDGVRINDVGIRLKGHASLMGLRGGRGGGGGPPGFGEEPDQFPYLIKFDEFVSGQRYQGYAELAIRTGGNRADAALMREPVSNYVFDAIGLPISQTAYAGVRLNNEEEEKLYTMAEHVDEVYVDKLYPDKEGVLYKAQPFADLSYRGADPTLYAQVFEQKSNINDDDLASLIDFLRFVTEATDEEFERDLAQHFDVDAFATYLAVNNLLANTDSLAGMGNNYYFYIELDRQYTTLLAWDTNESLGKLAGRFAEGGAKLDLYYEYGWGGAGENRQEQPPSRPWRAKLATDSTEETTAQEENLGPQENLLKERFFATPSFRLLYEEKLKESYEKIFLDDLLTPKINQYADLIRQANQQRDLVEQAEFDQRVNQVLEFVRQRKDFLSSTELLQAIR